MASSLPSEIQDLILSFVPREDLPAVARTARKFRDHAQKLIFCDPIQLTAHESDDNEEQTSPSRVYSFVFALLSSLRLRTYVRSLWLDFGCYCRDSSALKRAEESRMIDIVGTHAAMGSREMTPRVRALYDKMGLLVATCLEDHVWYARMFLLALCYVPRLRDLTVWFREWGRNNRHRDDTEGHMVRIAELLTSRERLPELKCLKVQTWAEATAWSHDAHPFTALLSLPSLEDIYTDDVLAHGRPRDPISAKRLSIRSPELVGDNDGEVPNPEPETKFVVMALFMKCSNLEELDFTPRTTVESLGGMILHPLATTLTRLKMGRSLSPGHAGVTNLSSLFRLKSLEINWTFLTYAFFNRFDQRFRPLDLVENLPRSLDELRITNGGRSGEEFDWTTLEERDVAVFRAQFEALAWDRYTMHRPPKLTVIFDVFPAYRAESLRMRGNWHHEHWADFEAFLRLRHAVMEVLLWVPKETVELLWKWHFTPAECDELRATFDNGVQRGDVSGLWKTYYEASRSSFAVFGPIGIITLD